jgi:hypothetical protein
MADLLTVKNPPDYQLKVGASSENYIAFEITATKAATRLQAQITIPCGKTAAGQRYLCADGNNARLTPSSEPGDELTFISTRKEKSISWKSKQFSLDANEKVTIKIAGFNPEQHGDAGLQLKIMNPGSLHDQSFTVSIKPAQGPAILYFEATPANVLQKGEVNITAITTGAKTVKLYANEAEVTVPKSTETKESVTVVRYTHRPQADTTYHLKAWQTAPGVDEEADVIAGKLAQRKNTVWVRARPGWYSWDLLANRLEQSSIGQTFYPTLLLTGEDLSGATVAEKLYGIFVCKETRQAELWSSSSGLDDWSYLGDVPDGMAESPGVIHKNALWLIGGSSADPLGNVSDRICWYYKNKDQEMVWKEWDEEGSERDPAKTIPPRRCHACAVFDGKVWVMGGLSDQDKTLDDVWTCAADPVTGDFTATWVPSHPLPSPRCLPVVTATPAATTMVGVKQPRLWLCGGTTHPYNKNETFYDLYWTEDGKGWVSLHLPKENAGAPTQVLSATILYDRNDRRLHVIGIFLMPGPVYRGYDYELKDTEIEAGWAQGTVIDFDWNYPTELFLIRSVSFPERWIFSPLYQDQAKATSYKVRIYITPSR